VLSEYINWHYVGFEVLTAVIMKITIFWDITPCSPLSVNRRFGGTYCLHLQGRKISRARSQCKSRWQAEPKVNRRFRGTYRLLQGQSASQASNQQKQAAGSVWMNKLNLPPASPGFLLGILFDPKDGGDVPPKFLAF
jgi:hypothetical protein